MARIRTIKPEFWTDESITECSVSARLLFIGLWNFADDSGSICGSSRQLKALVFPCDNFELEPLLSELVNKNLIIPFSVDNKNYYYIKNFTKHQSINRPSHPKYPKYEPSVNTQGVLTEHSPGETETETETDIDTLSGKAEKLPDHNHIPYKEIIEHLNARTKQSFRDTTKDTREHIKARWDEGHRLEEFKKCIDNMTMLWMDDPKMSQYLRPATLFAKGKFEGYVNRVITKKEMQSRRGEML
jgi:uncharacterized phage protein (TIGR02220 family)